MKVLKRFGILLLALLCVLPLLSSCKKDEEEETVYYTVTFNSNGGNPVEKQTVAAEEAVLEPTPPTREGYIFEGWRNEHGSFWNFSSDFVTSDITLTAEWISPTEVFAYAPIDENTAKITALKQTYPTLAVPSVIEGLLVTTICDGVFADLSFKEVESITLPHTITSVGHSAFANCRNISIIFDPRAELTEIGESAFYDCNLLSSVRFGEGLTSLAPEAFFGCSLLEEIRLPKSLTFLADNVFTDCSSLISVMLHPLSHPDPEFHEIADSVFKGCNSLKAIYFHGTQAQFEELCENGTDNLNQPFLDATPYFYSGEPVENQSGDYWYFDNNGNPKLW